MPSIDEIAAKAEGKNGRYSLFETTISPGERASLGLPLPEMLGYAPLYMPVKVINGKTAGPTVLLFATLRGDEFNGMEILKQLLELSLLDRLRGTLLVVPVLNVFGMLNRSATLPDGQTLDLAFPGKAEGDYTGRTAHLFFDSLFSKADVCVELCSGGMNHNFLPHVYGDFSMEANRELAEAFAVSVAVDIEPRPGSLSALAKELGKPMLTFRAGEAMRFNRHAIRLGRKGLVSLLRRLKMLPESDSPQGASRAGQAPVFVESSDWVHATKSGIAHPKKALGDRVTKGETLAVISEPLGSFQEVTVTAPSDGVLVGANDMPLVFEGDYLFRIATFDQLDEAADRLQEWTKEELPASTGELPTTEETH